MYFKKLLAIDALFEGGRMFVGAMSIMYLMNSGITIGQIGLLKSIQAVTILLGEYPSGVFADMFGRKKSLMLSLFTAILSFIIFAFGKALPEFIIAEVLAALSLCFWSGAFESFAIEEAKLENEKGLMDRFFHFNQSFNSVSVLVFGVAGGVFAHTIPNLPYQLGAVILFISFLILLTVPETHFKKLKKSEHNTINLLKNQIKQSFTHGIFDSKLFPFFLFSILLQFLIQPLLHLWQPLFSNLSSPPQSINSIVFGVYCSVNAFSGIISAKLSKNEWYKKNNTLFILLGFFSVFYLSISFVKNWILALAIFSLMQGILSTTRTIIGIKTNSSIPSHLRASILSSMSLFSRFGMISALQWIQITSASQNNNVSLVFYNFSLVTIIILFFGSLFYYNRNLLNLINLKGAIK